MVIGGFVLIFVVLLAVLGGKKGIGALLGLLFTLACVWFILIPALIIGLPIIAAVSYTHLDVYKRQSVNRLMGAVLMEIHDKMLFNIQGIFTKCSYRKIDKRIEDVYKRQVCNRFQLDRRHSYIFSNCFCFHLHVLLSYF